MRLLTLVIFVLFVSTLNGCSTIPANQQYVAPEVGNAATIKLNNVQGLQSAFVDLTNQDHFEMLLRSIDGKIIDTKDQTTLSPGHHTLVISCILNYTQSVGEKAFEMNAQPGRVYQFSWNAPKQTGCQGVSLSGGR